MDDLIGKQAYLKRGFFSGVIGIIKRNDRDNAICPYLIETDVGDLGFSSAKSIQIVER